MQILAQVHPKCRSVPHRYQVVSCPVTTQQSSEAILGQQLGRCPSNGPVWWEKSQVLGGTLSSLEIQPESRRDGQQEGRAWDSAFRFCYKSARGGVWQERRAWQRVDLEKAQCPGRSFGARTTDVISPGARAAVERQEGHSFFLLLCC